MLAVRWHVQAPVRIALCCTQRTCCMYLFPSIQLRGHAQAQIAWSIANLSHSHHAAHALPVALHHRRCPGGGAYSAAAGSGPGTSSASTPASTTV